MDKLYIEGGQTLSGTIEINGAKNALLPLMAASLLTDETLVLKNVQSFTDTAMMGKLLEHLGVTYAHEPQKNTLTLSAQNLSHTDAPYDLVRKMRASILVLAPLIARHKKAAVSLPGGCAIGTRPVDLHIKGLQALGAEITLTDGYIHATAPSGLKGTKFTFPKKTVTGTANLLMAAVLAEGETQLVNAASEPEILDLISCLKKMGAEIEGAGSDMITICGVKELKGCIHHIIPDRIEAGTYLVAAAMTGGELLLKHARADHLPTEISLLQSMGVHITPQEEGISVRSPEPRYLKGLNIKTQPFPGFATDLQAQFMALLTLVPETSIICEAIFENRFMHIAELLRMGADISAEGNTALIKGVSELTAAPVMATDLRASVSLVLAGLAARGTTEVNRLYHLDRGYTHLDQKLRLCGAKVHRISATQPDSFQSLNPA